LNIVKHAQAKTVLVRLARCGDTVRVEVKDDGRGFDLLERASSGRGLKNIDMRARRMGGTSSIESSRSGGTRIVVDVPLELDA
jgi:signal transduction histidine kinase